MNIIEFNKVSKRYRIQAMRYRTFREDVTNLARRLAGRGAVENDGNYIWALRDVEFAVEAGEVVGIVGPNGAGKSTILKILSRVTYPTKGTVQVGGRFVSMIELGAGFHPELTGRENIYMNGIVMGMKKHEIEKKFDAIVEFSELADFIDTPVKRYSSGMFVRLAFSVMIHVEPEILFIDEILAVGDFHFREKCLKKMNQFRDEGKTMIIVSHLRYIVETLCTRAIFLHKGKILYEDKPTETMDYYYHYVGGEKERGKLVHEIEKPTELEIFDVKLLNKDNEETGIFQSGDHVTLQIHFRTNAAVENPVFRVGILNELGIVHGTSNLHCDKPANFDKDHRGIAEVKYNAPPLLQGHYEIEIIVLRNLYSQLDTAYDIVKGIPLNITSSYSMGGGIISLEHNWEFKNAEENIQQ
ncbi:MAG: ABC transporter ATP-binding protein [bacterium]